MSQELQMKTCLDQPLIIMVNYLEITLMNENPPSPQPTGKSPENNLQIMFQGYLHLFYDKENRLK